MALLLKDREPASGTTAEPSADAAVAFRAPDFACETCGAEMQRGQDWCLECGTAAPGRLDARPGWRAAAGVVGLTTMVLLCAVVAAYAALTSDAQRIAAAPSAGSAEPIVAQTPGAAPPAAVLQPGATGPGVTPPASATQPGPIIPVTPPPAGTAPPFSPPATTPPATATPARPITPPPSATPAKPAAPAQGAATAASGGAVVIDFAKDAAQTYDPFERAGAEFGPAKNAIDDSPKTVWDVVVPADAKPIAAGLVLDLGKPHALRSLRLATRTPGFTVEVYAAKSNKELPTDVIDKRWVHLTDDKKVEDDGLIVLKGKGEGQKFELLLLYITQPGLPEDPRVAIGDVTLRGTP